VAFWHECLPECGLDRQDKLRYADWLAENSYAKATQALKLSAVKSLLAFGQETGYLRFNVGVACKAPTAENKLAERILSEEDGVRVLHAPRSPRDKTILRLLYSGGCACRNCASCNGAMCSPG
jgi:site-specific recombinase XerD